MAEIIDVVLHKYKSAEDEGEYVYEIIFEDGLKCIR